MLAAAAVLVAVFVSGAALSQVAGWSLSHWRFTATAEPRIARYVGLSLVEEQILSVSEAVARKRRQLGYTGAIDSSQAGAQLQQALRAFAEEAGLVVSGSQLDLKVADPEQARPFDHLTVQLKMVGEPAALQLFLQQVHGAEPMMVLNGLDVATPRRSARERRRQKAADAAVSLDLSVNVSVSAYRLGDA